MVIGYLLLRAVPLVIGRLLTAAALASRPDEAAHGVDRLSALVAQHAVLVVPQHRQHRRIVEGPTRQVGPKGSTRWARACGALAGSASGLWRSARAARAARRQGDLVVLACALQSSWQNFGRPIGSASNDPRLLATNMPLIYH